MLGCAVAGCTLLLEVPEDPPAVASAQAPPDASTLALDASAGGDPEESTGAQTTPSEAERGESEPNGDAGFPRPSAPSPGGSSDAGSSVPDAALPSDAASPAGSCTAPESLGPNGGCYVALATLLSWPDARLSCRSRGDGWDLALIDDAPTNQFLANLIAGEAWLGGSDADEEGTWRWVIDDTAFWSGDGATGSAVNGAYDNWNSDEPNGGGNSDCLRMVATSGAWADLECSMLRASVCERLAP